MAVSGAVLLLILAAVAHGSPVRIFNGTEAEPHSWPHQVALYIDDQYQCGGCLISDEWVLTAAHCVVWTNNVDVLLGAHDITLEEKTQVRISSSTIEVHEEYDPSCNEIYSCYPDIALIRLSEKITFNEFIQPAKLPSNDIAVGTIATAIGWGRISPYSEGSSVLQQVDVAIMSNEECRTKYYPGLKDGDLCIDSAGPIGVCNGDSGGPLNYHGATYGIVSRGVHESPFEHPCEAEAQIFTRVHHFLPWIKRKTGLTSQS